MDSRERFTSRVADYVKYRPTYPSAVATTIRQELPLRSAAADVGSGTGISAGLLLDAGFEVFAVEPNAAMRSAAESALAANPRFHSVSGSAEATTLAPASVGLVLAAQAFHWFDPVATRTEFRRILRPGGLVAVLFNDRDATTPFGRAYEEMLHEFASEYANVRHRNLGEERHRAFLGSYREWCFSHAQRLDFPGLVGRVGSSSYVPKLGDAAYGPMCSRLQELFDAHQSEGLIELAYVTHLLMARW